ncbi:TPA: hypothetical protein JLP59_001537 [Escherichia coli]|nr:hypothetical protein [Salmonella enterica]QMC76023.1 hypothetical protein HVZ67_13615 [Escherichia fergusonii]HAW2398652.1 hypothetical protein [Escherichia coli]EGA5556306.1 hypothetical protein [Salmonella enterica]EIP2505885.1 hypothetical protein [Salmonella enterica]
MWDIRWLRHRARK